MKRTDKDLRDLLASTITNVRDMERLLDDAGVDRAHIDLHASPANAWREILGARKYTLPYFMVVRARMILLAAAGIANDDIARRLSTRREVVSLWRKRFFADRLDGLHEPRRLGRPRRDRPP